VEEQIGGEGSIEHPPTTTVNAGQRRATPYWSNVQPDLPPRLPPRLDIKQRERGPSLVVESPARNETPPEEGGVPPDVGDVPPEGGVVDPLPLTPSPPGCAPEANGGCSSIDSVKGINLVKDIDSGSVDSIIPLNSLKGINSFKGIDLVKAIDSSSIVSVKGIDSSSIDSVKGIDSSSIDSVIRHGSVRRSYFVKQGRASKFPSLEQRLPSEENRSELDNLCAGSLKRPSQNVNRLEEPLEKRCVYVCSRHFP
jgi:hypothetical protein